LSSREQNYASRAVVKQCRQKQIAAIRPSG
jgi:hypothetical protein